MKEKDLNLEGLLYNVDDEGSTLLHLAVDSGILPVRHIYELNPLFFTATIGIFETLEIDSSPDVIMGYGEGKW